MERILPGTTRMSFLNQINQTQDQLKVLMHNEKQLQKAADEDKKEGYRYRKAKLKEGLINAKVSSTAVQRNKLGRNKESLTVDDIVGGIVDPKYVKVGKFGVEEVQQTKQLTNRREAFASVKPKQRERFLTPSQLKTIDGTAGHIESFKAVVEHFTSDDTEALDDNAQNGYTKADKALTNAKKSVKGESGFCFDHWHEISSAIVIIIVVIFFTLVIQIFTGCVKLTFVDNNKVNYTIDYTYSSPDGKKPGVNEVTAVAPATPPSAAPVEMTPQLTSLAPPEAQYTPRPETILAENNQILGGIHGGAFEDDEVF